MNKNKTFKFWVCCLSALLIVTSTVIVVKNKQHSSNAVFSEDKIFLSGKEIEQLQKEHFKAITNDFNAVQAEMDAMQNSIFKPFDNANKSEFLVEVKNNDSEYQVIITNHGVKLDTNSVNLMVQPHQIVVSADYNVSNVSDKNGKKSSVKSSSSFYRAFNTQEKLDCANVDKQIVDNKLVITIPILDEQE